MNANRQGSIDESGLRQVLRTGRILPIQVQLAASLGHGPALAIGFPELKLELDWVQWLARIHKGLPTDLERVLRSCMRGIEYALPPRLTVTWGADCAERALPTFESLVPGDDRPRRAVEAARAWVSGQTEAGSISEAALAVHVALEAATTAAEAAGAQPKPRAPTGEDCYAAESAAYAAREAAQAAGCPQVTGPKDRPWLWQVADEAAHHAGHAANWAAHASPDRAAEHVWQRQRLIELILSWDPDTWGQWRSAAWANAAPAQAGTEQARVPPEALIGPVAPRREPDGQLVSPVEAFHLRYELNVRQRLVPLLTLWAPYLVILLPALAGAVWMAVRFSWWLLLLVPLVAWPMRGLLVGILQLILAPTQQMDIVVQGGKLGVLIGPARRYIELVALLRIARMRKDTWTLYHYHGAIVNIPVACISEEQIAYIKSRPRP